VKPVADGDFSYRSQLLPWAMMLECVEEKKPGVSAVGADVQSNAAR